MQGVFDSTLPDGRAPATLSVRGGALVATLAGEASSDAVELALPLVGLQLEIGGADGHVVFCRHPDHPGRVLHGRGAEMRALLLPHVGAADQALLERKLREGPRSIWGPIAGFAVGLVLVLWLLTRSAGLFVGMLPMSVDQTLGAAAKPLVLADATGKVVTEPAVRGPVDAIMARIVASSAMPELGYDLTIVRSETVNAFAMPGGYVVVFTGLLKQIETPDQLAAVLAHEWTHVTDRHGLRSVAQSLGVIAVIELALGDVTGVLGSAVELFSLSQVRSYGRELEEASDAEAVRILARGGWDPGAVAGFFASLAAHSPSSEAPEALAWLSTHPSHAERVAAAQALAKRPDVRTLRDSAPDAPKVDWGALRAALRSEGEAKAPAADAKAAEEESR